MFVAVGRVLLDVPAASSSKERRNVARRVVEKLRSRFNVSAIDLDTKGNSENVVVGFAVVSNDRRSAEQERDRAMRVIEEMYVATITQEYREVLEWEPDRLSLPAISTGERTLAEVEGLGAFPKPSAPGPGSHKAAKPKTLDEARVLARRLRNKRDWE